MNIIKKPFFVIGVATLFGIGISSYAFFGGSSARLIGKVARFFPSQSIENKANENNLVRRMALQEEVLVAGKVKSAQSVDLAFERAGRANYVNTYVGHPVSVGQTLVTLDSSELSAQLAQMKAGIDVQKAKLDQLKAGATPETIAAAETVVNTAQSAVDNAQKSLDNAKQNFVDKLQDAFLKADDAIRGKTDQMFSNPQTPYAFLLIFMNDSNLQNDLNTSRLLLESYNFRVWKSSLEQLSVTSDLSAYAQETREHLATIKIFLDKLALGLNNPSSMYIVNRETVPMPSNWKMDISTARANINSAISNMSAAETALQAARAGVQIAQGGLQSAQDQLLLKKAAPQSYEVAVYEGQIRQAEAAANIVKAQIAKTILRAPFAGIVSKLEVSVGELVAPTVPVITLISGAQYEIESYISEADIATVSVGSNAQVTLDTYGGTGMFDAKVVVVDPSETVINGINAYKVTLQFTTEDERIKSGMTANIRLITSERDNVLAVPERAVITRNNDTFVLIDTGEDSPEERKVVLGIKGSNGYREIMSGLTEGEKIMSFGTITQ